MHINIQIKAKKIYMAPIYMYTRLRLGLYGPYICIYTDIEACTQSRAYVYIYIYILESWCARPNLACRAQYSYKKLWYITLSFHKYYKNACI